MKTSVVGKKPVVVEKNLIGDSTFKYEVYGYADKDKSKIVLHDRMRDGVWLEVYLHEHLHCFFPDLPEAQVDKFAQILKAGIWKRGYRRNRKKKKTKQ